MVEILGKIWSNIVGILDLDPPGGDTWIHGPPAPTPDDCVITYIVSGLYVQQIHTLFFSIQPLCQNQISSLRNQSEISLLIST